jgi:hypothetical protein
MARAGADGGFAGGQVPLRDSGADLDICHVGSAGSWLVVVRANPSRRATAASPTVVFARTMHSLAVSRGTLCHGGAGAQRVASVAEDAPVVPLRYPPSGQLGQCGVCRARVGRYWRHGGSGRSHIGGWATDAAAAGRKTACS